jgi:hypothetical protein
MSLQLCRRALAALVAGLACAAAAARLPPEVYAAL